MADPIYLWPSDNTRMRTNALVPYGSSGLLLPLWPNGSRIWTFDGSTLTSGTVALPSNSGFIAADTDGASGAWVLQYSGSLVHYASGGATTNTPLPGGQVYVGCTYLAAFAQPYVVSSNGLIYQGSGAVPIGGYGQAVERLASSGKTLFSLVSGSLASFGLTLPNAGAASFLFYPPKLADCIAASTATSAVAVGGWSYATFASAYTQMAFSPANAVMLALNGSNKIDMYQGPNDAWALTSSTAVPGNPAYAAWVSGGTSVLISDPSNGQINIYSYALGVLTLAQSLTLIGASAIAVTPDGLNALVCQPLSNQVVPYTLTGSTWVQGTPVGVTNPQCLLTTAPTSAVIGGNAGLTFLSFAGGSWSVAGTTALPFRPNGLATASGNILAAGTAGGSGMFSVASGSTALLFNFNWPGSADSIFYEQGQIFVSDKTAPLFWVFGNLFTQYQSIFTIPPTQPFPNVVVSPGTGSSVGGTIFGMASGSTSLYTFTSPYNIEPLRTGVVGILSSGNTWASATLGSGHTPTALTFDVSGNVIVATLQNDLYQISQLGSVLSHSIVPQFSGQSQSTPLGISALAYIGSGLYAASSLAGPLVRISG